jgi:hypothetical protein
MKYLIRMHKEIEIVADYQKKLKVDPRKSMFYEKHIFSHCQNISSLNNKFLEMKQTKQEQIENIFVVFRSNEAKHRVLKAHKTNPCKKLFCPNKYYQKLKIEGKKSKIVRMKECMDPSLLIWHNLSIGSFLNATHHIKVAFVMLVILAVSFMGQVYFKYLHAQMQSFEKRECNLESEIPYKLAMGDYMKDLPSRQGIYSCYCMQLFYADKIDDASYCGEWLTLWSNYQISVPMLALWICAFNVVMFLVLNAKPLLK